MPDSSTDPAQASTGQTTTSSSVPLIIPNELKKQFPELIDLITASESMNDEERQYWINILPIMTPEQLKNLREILTTERTQLAAIDAQYSKAIDTIGQEEFLKHIGEERERKAKERTQAESSAKAQEDSAAQDILKNIEGQ